MSFLWCWYYGNFIRTKKNLSQSQLKMATRSYGDSYALHPFKATKNMQSLIVANMQMCN